MTIQVEFIDPIDGDPIDLVTSARIINLSLNRKSNDVSDFSLSFVDVDRVWAWAEIPNILAEVSYFIDGARYVEGTFMVDFFNLTVDEDGQESILVSGKSLERWLMDRIVVPEDDYTGAGGWSTKQAAAAIVIGEFVRDQLTSPYTNTERKIDGLSQIVSGDLGNIVFERVQYEPVLEVVKRVALAGGIDFKITRTIALQSQFEVGFFGVDRTRSNNEPNNAFYLFAQHKGNMIAPSLSFDRRKTKTFFFVFGQGPEEDREIVPWSAESINAGRWNRIEARIDARNNERGDFEGFVLTGEEAVKENAARRVMTFKIPDTLISEYHKRWDLWDTVTAQFKGIEIDLRIVQVSIKYGIKGLEIDITLAEAEVASLDPEVALYRAVDPSEATLALALQAIAGVRKLGKKVETLSIRTAQAEWSNARPRRAYDEVQLISEPVAGMHVFCTDGLAPGETTGNGTGVPATYNGSTWKSDLDGSTLAK